MNIPLQGFASKCNIEKSNLGLLVTEGTNPTINTLFKIAECLDLSISELTKKD